MEKSDGSPPKKALFAQKASSYAAPQLYPNFPHNLQFADTRCCVDFMKIGYFFHRNLLHISGNFRNFALAIRRVDLPTAEAWRSLGYV